MLERKEYNTYKINTDYVHQLQYIFSCLEKTGIRFDLAKFKQLEEYLSQEINIKLANLSNAFGMPVYFGQRPAAAKKTVGLNLGSNQQTLKYLKSLGHIIPKVRPTKKQKEQGNTEYRESVNEVALRKIFAESQDQNIWAIIELRELKTLYSRYVSTILIDGVYYTNFDVAGTKTGRRSSKELIFGWGGNSQNWPKHGNFASKFRECAIARKGKILINVDQKGAEEWPVMALSQNLSGLAEAKNGINRHRKLAAFIFNLLEEQIAKSSIQYYLGKKSRHANNYGMRANTMSEQLAAEGFAYTVQACKEMLYKVHVWDPSVRNIYHKDIEDKISESEHKLITPFGRERIFFGFRKNDPNYDLWNDAYSWIPQSVVGDNTGQAITYWWEKQYTKPLSSHILGESHDSMLLESDDNKYAIEETLDILRSAFNRVIRFDNGIEITIPIEAEIGYNLRQMDTVTI